MSRVCLIIGNPNKTADSEMPLLSHKCFTERNSCPEKSDISFKGVNQGKTTLHPSHFHTSLRCIDRFRKSARLRVSSGECPEKIRVSAAWKLHCLFRELDCFGAVAN